MEKGRTKQELLPESIARLNWYLSIMNTKFEECDLNFEDQEEKLCLYPVQP